jgi:hypothetical protein
MKTAIEVLEDRLKCITMQKDKVMEEAGYYNGQMIQCYDRVEVLSMEIRDIENAIKVLKDA